jgi:catechol 2,3-dioxygenase-like lactoylglutathione lyase family enzyme
VDYRLEVVTLPVADVDAAKTFYEGLGWRLEADIDLGGGARIVQFTPPGSACSISFGTGLTPAVELVVNDVDSARADLARRGVEVSEVFHREGAKFLPGPDPERRSYFSYTSFNDPSGNSWLVQEITTRLPGRTTSPLAVYGTVEALADALRRAAAAHGRHEEETGQPDPNWPDWYAQYMADESADTGTDTDTP